MGGNILDGTYRVGDVLAEGGMGVVYRGEHRQSGQSAAIKFLSREGISDRVAYDRFLQEARLAARIEHRGIIKVYSLGITQGGIPFIVMELLEGQDLDGRLDAVGHLEIEEAVKVTEQILEALAAVHASHVIHRDLKPGNVFLARQPGGEALVKLLDFGVCMLLDTQDVASRLTGAGYVLGTPYYVSPEAVRDGANPDHRSDLYSTGVLLFEMLTGRPPFDSENLQRLLVNVATRPPPDPRMFVPDLPASLAELILRSLEKRPDRRYQSAESMLGALRDSVDVGSGSLRDTSTLKARRSSSSMYSIISPRGGSATPDDGE
jgi:serine/threonine-protein kinase